MSVCPLTHIPDRNKLSAARFLLTLECFVSKTKLPFLNITLLYVWQVPLLMSTLVGLFILLG
jgi:hypothetical protein